MENSGRISAKVSLEGTKDLYLIIVGIGITEALMHTGDFKKITDFFPYLVLLAGYLFTVFRFSLGMINMLSHVAERVHNHWTRVVSVVAMTFLACGLCFFWMGLSLRNLPMLMFNTVLLLLCHWATLFVCHRPWAFPRGWGWWMLGKTLAICFFYPAGLYDPRRDERHYAPLCREELTVKTTHYQWIRSNFWLMLLLAASMLGWEVIIPGALQMRVLGYELWLGLLLGVFALWDFKVNKAYYFGDETDWKQPNL
jgi:hypothetical protein